MGQREPRTKKHFCDCCFSFFFWPYPRHKLVLDEELLRYRQTDISTDVRIHRTSRLVVTKNKVIYTKLPTDQRTHEQTNATYGHVERLHNLYTDDI